MLKISDSQLTGSMCAVCVYVCMCVCVYVCDVCMCGVYVCVVCVYACVCERECNRLNLQVEHHLLAPIKVFFKHKHKISSFHWVGPRGLLAQPYHRPLPA